MDIFNSNNTFLDCSVLENLFLEKGILKSFKFRKLNILEIMA